VEFAFLFLAFSFRGILAKTRASVEAPLTPAVTQAVEQMRARAGQAEPLTGEPCAATLVWERNTGAPGKLTEAGEMYNRAAVFLNGERVEWDLGPGGAIPLTLRLKQNEILLAHLRGVQADARMDAVAFEAVPGGNLAVVLDYSAGELTVSDNSRGRYARPVVFGRKVRRTRVRPVTLGSVLLVIWSFLNVFAVIGMVPLFMYALNVGDPNNERYARRRRKVIIWNLVCSVPTAAMFLFLFKALRGLF